MYQYRIYKNKNQFLTHTAYFYPYPLDINKLNEAAAIVKTYTDFTGFSKRNTQVKNCNCKMIESRWFHKNDLLIYEVKGNRFLRGMVRALTATMLKVGRNIITIDEFKTIIEEKNRTAVFFDTPAHGLFLMEVKFV
jgi:tRNA pseudouridine38-40 synthase